MSPGLPPACRPAFLQVRVPVHAEVANTRGAPTLRLGAAFGEPRRAVKNAESRCQR